VGVGWVQPSGRPVEHNLGRLFLKLSCFIDVAFFFLCLE